MAEIKTKKNDASVEAFLNTVKEEQKRKDSFTILELMKKATKCEPKMWGGAIIGLGDYRYFLSDGKPHEWFMLGFSPRSQKFALYLMGPKGEAFDALLGKLGKYAKSKGCMYINKLADVETKILLQIFELQVKSCKAELEKD